MYIYSQTSADLLIIETEAPLGSYRILDAQGEDVSCPLLDQHSPSPALYRSRLDASLLDKWSVDHPVLYTFLRLDEAGQLTEQVRFGHTSLRTDRSQSVLLNDAPIYLRGFIRGITAHDHPNMTGGDLYEAARKNISQAKKYGFNLVRFHSTIPSEEFVQAADELGFLIHMEIGFAYEMDDQGHKKKLSLSNEAWVDTIMRYRNHPSAAIFCIGNELHNSGHFPEVHALYEQGKRLAPSKLIVDNSGWGEYDRPTADIYCQHVAYFFPMGVHRDMFLEGESWKINGSVSDQPLSEETAAAAGQVRVSRHTPPLRPMLSHEAMHYIDVPDYDALNAKYDAFAARVGQEYLNRYGIQKPRYLTELPALIRQKGLENRMSDYIAGSRQFKLMAMKIFMERLRLSPLCGYEMLQFSDCLKYENKNGIVDFFDDDKGIDPGWMKTLNSDLVLLADYPEDPAAFGESFPVKFYASDFLTKPEVRGDLTITLDDDILYKGKDFALACGLQPLVDLTITVNAENTSADASASANVSAARKVLSARFVCEDGQTAVNRWVLWFYPAADRLDAEHGSVLETVPASGSSSPASPVFTTDTLDEAVFEHLSTGETVILNYEYGAERNKWQMPGALERFKPCIWDRGSNLGGIIYNEKIRQALASGRYFDRNLRPLLEAGSKVNLDDIPFAVEEHISGIDKPVRDRMKGLQQGIKHFIAEDTLRQFCHLFSVHVGKGLLIVCTLNLSDTSSPVVAAFCRALKDASSFETKKEVSPEVFRGWLEDVNSRPMRKEDVMNHFWELDNKLVEDALFWEEVGVDLRKL